MLAGIFHSGSGCGDQLFRYITVRTLAEWKEYEWGMINPEQFKGSSFMNLDLGKNTDTTDFKQHFEEKRVFENGLDIRSYDPEINFVEDNTIIDGSFEDSKYWGHNLPTLAKWLKVERLKFWDNECVIGFRGGEYATVPELFLPTGYYDKAIAIMSARGVTKFEVHTDDIILAQQFFPDFPCVHDIGVNWRSHRFAKNAIIPNSAFYILPRLLKHHEDPEAITIAPRGWSRRNIAKGKNAGDFIWGRPCCYYPQFFYI